METILSDVEMGHAVVCGEINSRLYLASLYAEQMLAALLDVDRPHHPLVECSMGMLKMAGVR